MIHVMSYELTRNIDSRSYLEALTVGPTSIPARRRNSEVGRSVPGAFQEGRYQRGGLNRSLIYLVYTYLDPHL